MKILFIRSGNNGRDPISTRQGESLQKIGLEIDFYDVIGKGILGYLANIPQLRKYIHKVRPDIIHAHYSLCGIVAALARPKLPIVTSLMGSDLIQATLIIQLIIRQLSRHIWTRTIVKSNDLFQRLKNDRAIILLNGVDSDLFFEMDKNQALEKLGWSRNIKHILFLKYL